MLILKGKSDIGDQINKHIVAPLFNANQLSDPHDFNDPVKLGTGKEMVDRLTNLIGIFETPALDFSKNRADGNDPPGDATEYLMRHFATESGNQRPVLYACRGQPDHRQSPGHPRRGNQQRYLRPSGWSARSASVPIPENGMVLGTANSTVEMAVGSQLSATVSEGNL